METFKSVASSVITEECYNNYVEDLNFFDVDCFKTVVSKVLGFGIVLGSVFVKAPQIQKIVAAKSGEGLSFTSILMELFAYTTMLAYSYAKSFPFSSYGDSLFVMIQTVMIGFLFLKYGQTQKNSGSSAYMFVLMYGVFLYALVGGLTPVTVLASMQALNVPVVIVAKSVQIVTNFQNSSTGQLSAITQALLFFGSLARIFTSIQETGDFIIILSFVVGVVMNGIIMIQILYYWNSAMNVSSKKRD